MSLEKDKALVVRDVVICRQQQRSRRDMQNAFMSRDAARTEVSHLIGAARKTEARVDENIAAIDRSNAVLESKKQGIITVSVCYV